MTTAKPAPRSVAVAAASRLPTTPGTDTRAGVVGLALGDGVGDRVGVGVWPGVCVLNGALVVTAPALSVTGGSVSRGVSAVDSRSSVDWLGTGCRTVPRDRKSTRLNSSHVEISYAVFCLKKKTKKHKNSVIKQKNKKKKKK